MFNISPTKNIDRISYERDLRKGCTNSKNYKFQVATYEAIVSIKKKKEENFDEENTIFVSK